MTYQYQCSKCNKIIELVRTLAERGNLVMCCGQAAKQVIAVNVMAERTSGGIKNGGEFCHAISETDEPVFIRDKHHFREECKKRNVRPLGLLS